MFAPTLKLSKIILLQQLFLGPEFNYELAHLSRLRERKIMTLNEIIQDIHGLETELVQLEKRYGLLSADFYHLYKAGELEQSRDFIQWVGYYEVKLEREARYREMMYAYLRELRGKAGLGALHLAPETTPPGAS